MTLERVTQNSAAAASPDTPTAHLDRPGDSLALVQHTFGYMPQDSLVLIGMAGGSSGGHLRVDLGPSAGDPYAMARQCAEWLAGPASEPAPDAAIALLFTRDAPSPLHGDLYDPLVHTLAGSLASDYEVELVHIWHAGGGSIRNYSCRDAACCPYPGHGIAQELEESLRRLPELHVPDGAQGPGDLLNEFLSPLASPSDASRRVMRRLVDDAVVPSAAQELLTLWDSALARTQRSGAQWIHTAESRTAALLKTLRTKRGRDTLVPLASAGYLPALAGTVFHDAVLQDPAVQNLEDEELLARLAGGLPKELSPARLDRLLEEYSRCWLGDTGSRPDWPRVEALEALLRELLAYAEAGERAAALTLKAWTEWAKGRSSVSSATVERLREESVAASDCTMADLIDRFSSAFGVCPWARVKIHSYSWWQTEQAGASPKKPAAFRE
ncbi:hypothetical protein GCM10028800_08150 [Nesterenkonia populi]